MFKITTRSPVYYLSIDIQQTRFYIIYHRACVAAHAYYMMDGAMGDVYQCVYNLLRYYWPTVWI